MNALVVYDSVFGNTEQVARSVAGALGGPEAAQAVRVGEVSPQQLSSSTLLIVGSPTRGFRATPATTKLLRSLPAGALQGVKVAAFDTRIAVEAADVPGFLRVMVRLFGYAADPIAKRLVQRGGQLVAPAEGFIVQTSEGPLKEGELERSADWARRIAAAE